MESLAQIEKNNPAFSILLDAEFEKNSIRTTGNDKYIVAAKDGWWHMYDQNGKQLIKPGKLKFLRLGGSDHSPIFNNPRFDDGYGAYKVVEGGEKRSIFIDSSGEQAIGKSFLNASAFSNGVARVQGDNKKYWFIDAKGKALTSEYHDLHVMEGERAFYSPDGKSWGLMDNQFKVIVKPKYKSVNGFTDDALLTSVQDQSGLWGYIDKTGKTVIPPRYTYASSNFHSGMASVSLEPQGDKQTYFFIDNRGNPLLGSLKIYSPADFYDSIAAVAKWMDVEICPGVIKNMLVHGAINTKGETVIPFVYERLAPIYPGQATTQASYIAFKSSRGKCRYMKHVDLVVDREGNAFSSSGELPRQVSPDAPFYEKLSIKSGSTKIDGKRRYGLNYYVEGEEERNYIKPQFERLRHVSGPFFSFLATTKEGKREGLIKIAELSGTTPNQARVEHFLNTLKAKAAQINNGPVIAEFDQLIAENKKLGEEIEQLRARLDAGAAQLAKKKEAGGSTQADLSKLDKLFNQQKELALAHDSNNKRIRELAEEKEVVLLNAISDFSNKLVSVMNRKEWGAADQMISSWSLSGEFGY
ncbi:WG repeat-containing protein [Mariprofundus sp. KV]|uniref:WG repeat-containing protein n=1 Tax=Mariprofundus sp. KV TaxID=2608715 RepID=UPI0015A1FE46